MKFYKSFHELLNDQDSNAIALIYDDNGNKISLSYAELISLVNNYPIPSQTSIGVLCENNVDTIVAIFALTRAKKQIVLLNPKDDISLLKKQIKAGDISFLLGNDELVSLLSDALVEDKNIDNNGNILFFTSGTTLSNKAVILTEESLCASAFNGNSLLPLKKDDVLLSILPLSHVFGFVCSLLWPLSNGASVSLTRGYRHLFLDGSYFKATVISMVPQIASFMTANNLINKELRLVLIGASSCSKDVVSKFQKNNVKVSCGYGLTETSSGVALSLGTDPDKLSICPLSEIKIAEDGEILISLNSKTMMKGYYRDEIATKEVMHDDYLHTGDLGKIDENGFLHLLGRKKDIILLDDGTKIFCPEYEEELTKLFNDSELAIALDGKKLVLYIYLNGKDVDVHKIVNQFNLNKPINQRIAKIEISGTPLPRTMTGKIKRYELGKSYE